MDFVKKRIWMMAAGVFGIWVLYTLGSVMFSKPKKPKTEQKYQEITQVKAPERFSKDDMKISIEKQVEKHVHRQQVKSSSALMGLEEQVRSIKEMLLDLDSKLSDITYGQQKIMKSVISHHDLLNNLHQVEGSGSSVVEAEEESIALYHLKALMQGRAWLVDSNGSTLTVTTGDHVPGYGKVLKILPDEGLVALSNDKVIVFNSEVD